MTFKEQLIMEADNLFVLEHVERIKKQLMEYCCKRKYTVSLLKAYTTLVLGDQPANHMDIFLTKNDDFEYYSDLFVAAFKALGFTDSDIKFSTENDEAYDSYTITLTW